MPWWAWIFIVSCALIPIISLGGAIPVVWGLCGAMVCDNISKSAKMKKAIKVLACMGVTVLAWGLFGVLILASTML